MRRLAVVVAAAVFLALMTSGLAAFADHRIEAGETLSEIASRYDVSVADLAVANNIGDADYVVAGTVLTIPGGGGGGGDSDSSGSGDSVYVVEAGDTLAGIASRLGTTVGEIARQNGLANPNLIVVGEHLTIPGATSVTAGAGPVSPDPGPSHRDPRIAAASYAEVAAAIEKWADRNGVDPDLAKALAWHESGWQQDVVSSTGAVGVMQLEPYAADHIAGNLIGVPDLDSTVLDDNVRMGVRYLRQLLVNFDGDERLALASYYQGERAVREIGVYRESEGFVSNVLANRARFRSGDL